MGDIIDISDFNLNDLIILPIIDLSNVPSGYINNCLVKIFGSGLDNANNVKSSFNVDGNLSDLVLSPDMVAFVLTAASQETGEKQKFILR